MLLIIINIYFMNARVRGRLWNKLLVLVSLTLKIIRCEINHHLAYTIISFMALVISL